MKPRNNARRTIVPLCVGIVLLMLCGAGIGPVAAGSNDVHLGDVYLNVLYDKIGTIPIAGNEMGWNNLQNSNSITFQRGNATHYYIADTATSAETSTIIGTYAKVIGDTRYIITVRYPNVPIYGYMYLKRDLSNPIGLLMGATATTDYAIKISIPTTFANGCKVASIALTNPDKSLTRIVGTNNGNNIDFSDNLDGYDLGIWTVTPVFQSGSANGFSDMAPSYIYGNSEQFLVKSADNSKNIWVSKASTPVPTPEPKVSATTTPIVSTPELTTPQENNSSNLTNLPDESMHHATPAYTPTLVSPAPFIGLIAGLGAVAFAHRLRR